MTGEGKVLNPGIWCVSVVLSGIITLVFGVIWDAEGYPYPMFMIPVLVVIFITATISIKRLWVVLDPDAYLEHEPDVVKNHLIRTLTSSSDVERYIALREEEGFKLEGVDHKCGASFRGGWDAYTVRMRRE